MDASKLPQEPSDVEKWKTGDDIVFQQRRKLGETQGKSIEVAISALKAQLEILDQSSLGSEAAILRVNYRIAEVSNQISELEDLKTRIHEGSPEEWSQSVTEILNKTAGIVGKISPISAAPIFASIIDVSAAKAGVGTLVKDTDDEDADEIVYTERAENAPFLQEEKEDAIEVAQEEARGRADFDVNATEQDDEVIVGAEGVEEPEFEDSSVNDAVVKDAVKMRERAIAIHQSATTQLIESAKDRLKDLEARNAQHQTPQLKSEIAAIKSIIGQVLGQKIITVATVKDANKQLKLLDEAKDLLAALLDMIRQFLESQSKGKKNPSEGHVKALRTTVSVEYSKLTKNPTPANFDKFKEQIDQFREEVQKLMPPKERGTDQPPP